MKKHYAKRNHMKQGKYYTDHLIAMTEEELHSKSDIAGELAHRDMVIDELTCRIDKLERQPIPDKKVTNKDHYYNWIEYDESVIDLIEFNDDGSENYETQGFISIYNDDEDGYRLRIDSRCGGIKNLRYTRQQIIGMLQEALEWVKGDD